MGQNLLDRVEVKPRLPLDFADARSIAHPHANLKPLVHFAKHSLFPPKLRRGPMPQRAGSLSSVLHF